MDKIMNLDFPFDESDAAVGGRKRRLIVHDGDVKGQIVPYAGRGYQVVIPGNSGANLAPLVCLGVSDNLGDAMRDARDILGLMAAARGVASNVAFFKIMMARPDLWKQFPASRIQELLDEVN